MESALYRTAL